MLEKRKAAPSPGVGNFFDPRATPNFLIEAGHITMI